MSGRDEHAADHERLARAEHVVGEPSTDERREIHEPRVRAVELVGVRVLPAQAIDEEENEERAHPVVREALPHLDGEQQAEAGRVAEEGAVGGHEGKRE